MHPWVAFTGLILLWADAVVSQARVQGVVGQPVTLPCTYSTAREITSMCWGQGACSQFKCSNELIWTDGYRVTFQKNKRYDLHGLISKGNVSLTIQDAVQSDSGTYCCRVEHTGWFNDLKMNLLLDVKPAPPKTTRAPTSPRVSTSAPTTPAPTRKLKTAPSRITSVPTSPRVSTSAATTPAPAPTQKRTTAPSRITSVPTSPRVSTSAPTTPAPTRKLKTAPPKVTSALTSPRVSTSAPTTPAPTRKLNTAPPKVTSAPTSPRISTSASTTLEPTWKLSTGPSEVTSAPTSPRVFTSAPVTPAPTQDILRETTSSSAMQTAETQPITPQETNTTSFSSTSCLIDGNSTVTQPSDSGWQGSGNHVSVKQNPGISSNKALYIGLITAALIVLPILASVLIKEYLCVRRKVVHISKTSSIELLTGTSLKEMAVHYQADENVHVEDNLDKVQ